MEYDLKITNGLIVDGTGTKGTIGDIAVKDGKVVARSYRVVWRIEKQGEHWLLDRSTLTELSKEPLNYYRP